MEAELKFVREKRHGIAVVGSCLLDAAARLGVFIDSDCGRLGNCDGCAVKVSAGGENLSEVTASETEQLSAARRKNGERLSCQAIIIKSGEISIMTEEKKKDEKAPDEKRADEYKKEFSELPLEKKMERLMELEAIAFGETVSYVMNAPYTIGGKFVDLLAQYGFKIEADAKKAKQPEQKTAEPESEKADDEVKRPKTKAKPAGTRATKKQDT